MSEADDAAEMVARLFGCAMSEPLRALALAAELAGAAADSHQRALMLLDMHIDTAGARHPPKDTETPRPKHVIDASVTASKKVMP